MMEVDTSSFTPHQTNVLTFLQQNVNRFLEYLISVQPQNTECCIIDDIFPPLIKFLDMELKTESHMHAYMSSGYHVLIDMIIELHVTAPDSELSQAMRREVSAAFRC